MSQVPPYDASAYPGMNVTAYPQGISSSGKLSMQSVYILSSAQLKAFQTTPIQLVSAPGVGFALVPRSMAVQYKFGAAAYTIGNADNAFQIEYTGKAVNLLKTIATGVVDQVVDMIIAVAGAVAGTILARTAMENLGLELKLTGTTPALTVGDGTVVITLGYDVLVLK